MDKNFDFEKFIKEDEQRETENNEAIAERESKNPMCLSCSQYFRGCCACE